MKTIQDLTDTPDDQLCVMLAELLPQDRWVIMKRGLFYRPNAHGYTSSLSDAWILPHAEAKKHEMYVDRSDVDFNDKVFVKPAPSPNYTYDLNAVHEVEKGLTDEQHHQFRTALFRLRYDIEGQKGDLERSKVSATARQRTIALIHTLQGGEA